MSCRRTKVLVSVLLAGTCASAAAVSACVLVQDLGSTGDAGAVDDAAVADAGGGAEGGEDGARDGGDDARDADATPSDGPTGPGPLGALPSGYCCTSDEECRFRRCVDTGAGGRMCLDLCSASRPLACTRPGFAFTCDGTTCQPPAGFACLDPATFVRGTKTTGACCTDSADGTTGHECEGNLCLAVGNAPWFCTRRCDGGADCPSDYECYPVGDRKECIPVAFPYACK